MTTAVFRLLDGGALRVTRDASGVWLDLGYPEDEWQPLNPRALDVAVVRLLGAKFADFAAHLASLGISVGVWVPRDVVRQSQDMDRRDAGLERRDYP